MQILMYVVFAGLFIWIVVSIIKADKAFKEWEKIPVEDLTLLVMKMISENPNGQIQKLEDKMINNLYKKREVEVDNYLLSIQNPKVKCNAQ